MPARTRPLAMLIMIAAPSCLCAQIHDELELSRKATTVIDLEGPSTVAPRGELVRQRFPNGAIAVERWVTESPQGDYVNHGPYMQYSPNGDVVESGYYEHGLRHGEWRKVLSEDESRPLLRELRKSFKSPFVSQARFVKGELSGDWTCSDADGAPVFVWRFKDGVRDGLSSWFDESGDVIRAITYRDNLAHGPAKVIVAKYGEPQDIQFNDGRMRHREERWYPSESRQGRSLRSQDWYLVPTPLNLVSHAWADNRVEYQAVDQDDKIRHGLSVSYYPNGQREAQGHYQLGKRSGTFVWWYANGQEKTRGQFQGDLEHGQWTWWHENGMKEARGSFEVGEQVATWSIWEADGKLVKRADSDHPRLTVRRPVEIRESRQTHR